MNKQILTIFISILLFSNIAFACISIPFIESKNENCNVQFRFEDSRNESAVLNILNEKKSSCNLNNEDISILKDYVINGYSVKEQTDEEYALFLQEANKANFGRPDDCLDYQAIYHMGRWTGYIKTGYHYDAIGGCAVPLCGGSPSTNIKWNDLTSSQSPYFFIFLLILLFVIVVAFVYKIRK